MYKDQAIIYGNKCLTGFPHPIVLLSHLLHLDCNLISPPLPQHVILLPRFHRLLFPLPITLSLHTQQFRQTPTLVLLLKLLEERAAVLQT